VEGYFLQLSGYPFASRRPTYGYLSEIGERSGYFSASYECKFPDGNGHQKDKNMHVIRKKRAALHFAQRRLRAESEV